MTDPIEHYIHPDVDPVSLPVRANRTTRLELFICRLGANPVIHGFQVWRFTSLACVSRA